MAEHEASGGFTDEDVHAGAQALTQGGPSVPRPMGDVLYDHDWTPWEAARAVLQAVSKRREVTMKVLIDGITKSGVRVRVEEGEGGYLTRFRVLVDGEDVPYSRASRLRDGGTTTIDTDRGVVFIPNRLPHPDPRPATFADEPLDESSSSDREATTCPLVRRMSARITLARRRSTHDWQEIDPSRAWQLRSGGWQVAEFQEVVEPDHDERAEDLRGWADGQRVLFRDIAVRLTSMEKNAASEQSRNYAEGYADAMEEVVKFVAERFNLTEGRDDDG
jgi:hypothetical protein